MAISGNYIKRLVGDYYKVDMQLSSRKPVSVRPRQIAMYLCRNHTTLSLQQIGNVFGGIDHTSVINNCKRVEALLELEPSFRKEIQAIVTLIEGNT